MPRRPRNARPDLNGVVVVDKPLGVTSMGVCRVIRAATGGAKVGHAGTLDPLATGVLVVCLGTATKHIDTLMAGEKRYTAEVDLSAFSTTDDMEGEATPVRVDTPPAPEQVRRACDGFVGEIMQRPPVFSAVHVGGERAYKTARKRARRDEPPPDRPPARPVVIDSIDILEYAFPRLILDIRCGKGTYIRSLARDLGEALGTGGRLTALRRTRVGGHTLEHARPLDDFRQGLAAQDLLPPPPGRAGASGGGVAANTPEGNA